MRLVSAIEARVAGHDLVFELPAGGGLQALEHFLRVPAYELLRRLTGDAWHVDEVVAVLVHAARPTRETGRMDVARDVRRAVDARPGLYRALAAQVIAARLVGVPLEEARFDDEDAGS